ncbi:MAG TPA: HYR domain-containing protein [Verrucomicrobiae bacterium]|nr:HYR domain-containing protein [Verrucomicrobiae bacterium]
MAALGLCLAPAAFGAVILVTNDYPTIQAAIDAASPNDTIQVQPGIYREYLNILKPVRIIGSGSATCFVHHTNDPLVLVNSPGVVELAGMDISGGSSVTGDLFSASQVIAGIHSTTQVQPLGLWPGYVAHGIVASNTIVVLNDVSLNTIANYMVTVIDGTLYATNMALDTRASLYSGQCDLGLALDGCVARIFHLTQQSGHIDHTINIDTGYYPYLSNDVQVDSSMIRASRLSWGECIRLYNGTTIVITNCDFYRVPGGDSPIAMGNQAVGVNGYSNTVTICGNLFGGMPTGLRVHGTADDSNRVKIEHNEFVNCDSNAVLVDDMPYEEIDLGGGPFQSAGQNYFHNPGASDVELEQPSGPAPFTDIHAASNCWTTANPDDSIWDKLDSPSLGRVLSDPAYCEDIPLCALDPELATNTVGTARTVTATVAVNGLPAAGVAVSFSVSGTQAISPTNVVTDGDGQASFTYTGSDIGTDTVLAVGNIGVYRFGRQATMVWLGVAPEIACPGDIVTNTAGGCTPLVDCTVTRSGTPTPAFRCNIGNISNVDLSAPYPFPAGTWTVNCLASNNYGTATCSFNVTVKISPPPWIVCPGDIVTNLPIGQTQADITFGAPTAGAYCDGTVTASCAASSGSTFPLGTNTVTCMAIDSTSNTNTCTFNVIVLGSLATPHDLTVLSVKPPKRIHLSTTKPSQTKPVKVVLQNLGPQAETIDTIEELRGLVTLAVESLGTCASPTPQIVVPRRGFPLVLAPKKKLTVVYNVTFDCASDPTRGAGHADFRYTVTLNHAALDGNADTQMSNDVCPRPPNPAIRDKGCGSKDPATKHLGADVLTDVVVKP